MKGGGDFDTLTLAQRHDLMDRLAQDCGWLSAAHARTAVLATRRALEPYPDHQLAAGGEK